MVHWLSLCVWFPLHRNRSHIGLVASPFHVFVFLSLLRAHVHVSLPLSFGPAHAACACACACACVCHPWSHRDAFAVVYFTAGGMAAVSLAMPGIQPEGNVDAHSCTCNVNCFQAVPLLCFAVTVYCCGDSFQIVRLVFCTHVVTWSIARSALFCWSCWTSTSL